MAAEVDHRPAVGAGAGMWKRSRKSAQRDRRRRAARAEALRRAENSSRHGLVELSDVAASSRGLALLLASELGQPQELSRRPGQQPLLVSRSDKSVSDSISLPGSASPSGNG